MKNTMLNAAEKLADKYTDDNRPTKTAEYTGEGLYDFYDIEQAFKSGFLSAIKEQPEVLGIVQALNRVVEEYSQETINEPVGSLIARIDNANHFVKEALKAWGEFIGENK